LYKKIIENWLTNVNEIGYQIPFCSVLLSHGYTVLYVVRHGPGEHGKDIIARDPTGKLTAFQLKSGKIRLSDWRKIHDEVRDMVVLPVKYPGVKNSEKHTPILVTNGELTTDAKDSINEYAETWHNNGSEMLEVWTGQKLLKMFVDSHGSYFPSEVDDFRHLLELYCLNPYERFSSGKFAKFLENISSRELIGNKAIQKKRSIESLVLLASYIIGQYESALNYLSALEGWTILAITILKVAERDNISARNYTPSLSLVKKAYERNLSLLKQEIIKSPNFIQPQFILTEFILIGTRVTILLGWIAAAYLQNDEEEYKHEIVEVLQREIKNSTFIGEIDWPSIMILILCFEKISKNDKAKQILTNWVYWIVNSNTGKGAVGVASPYWTHERVIKNNLGLLRPHEREGFLKRSFTLLPSLDMMVRRNLRDEIDSVWYHISKITFCNFEPDKEYELLSWENEKGSLDLINWGQPVSWSKWKEEVQKVNLDGFSKLLLAHKEWLLPFVLTYPHRLNRKMNALIDQLYGPKIEVEERIK
jgi:hypothetical protein